MKPSHEQDHNYTRERNFIYSQQYADDISWITNIENRKESLKNEVPPILKEFNLQVNDSKTEEYKIKRNENEDWKTCKYLGSLLDTGKDINRRKILATTAYNQLKKVFDSGKLHLETKIRLFRSHIESIFLYNCEVWTVTKATENEINVFQRNLLRKILQIKWQEKITNEILYERTGTTEWSKKVKERRLKWYGHLLILPDDSPGKIALKEARKFSERPRGGQKITWIKTIDKDLADININIVIDNRITRITDHNILARNRKIWQDVINRAMLL